MSLGTRIRERRELLGLKQNELGKLLGVTGAAVGNYENGVSSPKAEVLYKIFDVLQCDANYLFQDEMAGRSAEAFSLSEIKMLRRYRLLSLSDRQLVDDVLEAAYNHTLRAAGPEEREEMASLRCYELPAAAGTGEPLGDTYYTHTIQVPGERLPRNAHVCIRVHGSSMEPAYRDGDLVFVQRLDGESLEVGEIGIFVLNGDGYIKRLGRGTLESLNPAYAPIPIHEYDDLRCQGRVLGKL